MASLCRQPANELRESLRDFSLTVEGVTEKTPLREVCAAL